MRQVNGAKFVLIFFIVALIVTLSWGLEGKTESTNLCSNSAAHSKLVLEGSKGRRLRASRTILNDPLYERQWYLHPKNVNNSAYLDHRITEVWDSGITGRGVTVAIVDDGLESNHSDLIRNFYPEASYDFQSNKNDPTPTIPEAVHGTRGAGMIAAQANNSICGTGVAFNSKIAGIRILNAEITDEMESKGLGFANHLIDVYCNCWGPSDDGISMEGPGELVIQAFSKAVKEGRAGKGNIFIWASGNGGNKDHCGADGYAQMIEVIVIAAVSADGESPWYAERCSAIMAVALSNSVSSETDKIYTTDVGNKCTEHHSGTSAAAALASGIFALVLSSNPNITWRQFQHLVVETSKQLSQSDPSWIQNGAGYWHSDKFGFGLLDAPDLVNRNVQQSIISRVKSFRKCFSSRALVDQHFSSQNKAINSSLIFDLPCETCCITKLEHVIIKVTIRVTGGRGRLSIQIKSPQSSKKVFLLRERPLDDNSEMIFDWSFKSLSHWGESPAGMWTIYVETNSPDNSGFFYYWYMIIHGSCESDNVFQRKEGGEICDSLPEKYMLMTDSELPTKLVNKMKMKGNIRVPKRPYQPQIFILYSFFVIFGLILYHFPCPRSRMNSYFSRKFTSASAV